MDLIGHCAVAAFSGVHDEADIFGPGIVELMLPNVLHCHDWGYQRLWSMPFVRASERATCRQMQTHLIADWIVHYGDAEVGRKHKQGWAYRRMGIAHRRMHSFFEGARRRDLLCSATTSPDGWSKKRKLDFAHSITEYALDFILAPEFMTHDRLADMCSHLSRMADASGPRGRGSILATARRLRVETDQSQDIVGRSIEALAHDAAGACEPEAFAVGTTVRKYGFQEDRRSASYVRAFIEGIAAELDQGECRALCRSIAATVAKASYAWIANGR